VIVLIGKLKIRSDKSLKGLRTISNGRCVFCSYKIIRVYIKNEIFETLMMSCDAKLEEGPTNPSVKNLRYDQENFHVARGIEVGPPRPPDGIIDAAIVALLVSPIRRSSHSFRQLHRIL